MVPGVIRHSDDLDELEILKDQLDRRWALRPFTELARLVLCAQGSGVEYWILTINYSVLAGDWLKLT